MLSRAVAAGHQVHTLVRVPSKLGPVSEHVSIVEGDVLDADAVDWTVDCADDVLSLFGQVKGSPPNLQTLGTRLIVEAMKRHGVSRLVTLSGGGLRAAQDRPGLPDKMIRAALTLMAGHVLADAEGHLAVLQESDLDWTVVRAPRLTEEAGKGPYRVGWVGVNSSTRISRDDLADFIVTQIDDRRFLHQMPFVSD